MHEETATNSSLQRVLKLPVLLHRLLDVLLRLLRNLSERQTAVSTKTLLNKVVKEVFLLSAVARSVLCATYSSLESEPDRNTVRLGN